MISDGNSFVKLNFSLISPRYVESRNHRLKKKETFQNKYCTTKSRELTKQHMVLPSGTDENPQSLTLCQAAELQ